MFQVLAADVATQRGEYEVAAKIYLELAINLKDPRLARFGAGGDAGPPAGPDPRGRQGLGRLEPDSGQARNTLARS
jgi:hypothetical protein